MYGNSLGNFGSNFGTMNQQNPIGQTGGYPIPFSQTGQPTPFGHPEYSPGITPGTLPSTSFGGGSNLRHSQTSPYVPVYYTQQQLQEAVDKKRLEVEAYSGMVIRNLQLHGNQTAAEVRELKANEAKLQENEAKLTEQTRTLKEELETIRIQLQQKEFQLLKKEGELEVEKMLRNAEKEISANYVASLRGLNPQKSPEEAHNNSQADLHKLQKEQQQLTLLLQKKDDAYNSSQAALIKLQEQLTSLQQEKESKIQSLTADKTTLSEKCDKLVARVKILEEDAASKKNNKKETSNSTSVEKELAESKRDADEQRTLVAEQHSKIQDLKKQLDAAVKKNTELEEALNQQNNGKNKEENSKPSKLEKQYTDSDYRRIIDQQKAQLAEKEKKIEELNKSLVTSANEKAKQPGSSYAQAALKTGQKPQEHVVVVAGPTMQQLKDSVSKLTEENKKLRFELASKPQKNPGNEAQLRAMEEIKTLRISVKLLEKTSDSLQEEKRMLENDVMRLQGLIRNNKASLELEKQMKEMQETLDINTIECNKLLGTIASLKTEKEVLKKKMEGLTKHDKIKERDLKDGMAVLQAKFDGVSNLLEGFQQKLDEKTKKIAELENLVSTKRETLTDLSNALSTSCEQAGMFFREEISSEEYSKKFFNHVVEVFNSSLVVYDCVSSSLPAGGSKKYIGELKFKKHDVFKEPLFGVRNDSSCFFNTRVSTNPTPKSLQELVGPKQQPEAMKKQ